MVDSKKITRQGYNENDNITNINNNNIVNREEGRKHGVPIYEAYRILVVTLTRSYIHLSPNSPDSGNLGRERFVFRLPVAELGLVDGVGRQVMLRRLVPPPQDVPPLALLLQLLSQGENLVHDARAQ